jgi:hypothetical protein
VLHAVVPHATHCAPLHCSWFSSACLTAGGNQQPRCAARLHCCHGELRCYKCTCALTATIAGHPAIPSRVYASFKGQREALPGAFGRCLSGCAWHCICAFFMCFADIHIVHVHAHTHTHTHTHTHARTHARTHAHTHTRTHARTHARVRVRTPKRRSRSSARRSQLVQLRQGLRPTLTCRRRWRPAWSASTQHTWCRLSRVSSLNHSHACSALAKGGGS